MADTMFRPSLRGHLLLRRSWWRKILFTCLILSKRCPSVRGKTCYLGVSQSEIEIDLTRLSLSLYHAIQIELEGTEGRTAEEFKHKSSQGAQIALHGVIPHFCNCNKLIIFQRCVAKLLWKLRKLCNSAFSKNLVCFLVCCLSTIRKPIVPPPKQSIANVSKHPLSEIPSGIMFYLSLPSSKTKYTLPNV